MMEADQQFQQALHQRAAMQDISRFFVLALEEVAPGQARVSMTCRPEMANIFGMIHGTALFALVDEAFQVAANSHGTLAVALNMNITFHQAPDFGERLTAVARERHATRRTATYDIEVTDGSGRLVASCQALAYRKGKPLEL